MRQAVFLRGIDAGGKNGDQFDKRGRSAIVDSGETVLLSDGSPVPPASTPIQSVVKYPPHSALRAVLNDRVQAYFQQTGLKRDGGRHMWIKTGLILAWLALSYTLLVFWAPTWWLAIPTSVS